MRRPIRLYRKARVHWWLHLIGWVVLAVPVALLLHWWLAPLGVVAFELLLTAAVLRVRRPVRPGGRGPDGSGGSAGVREPRRPLPVTGAGAAELPTSG